MYARILSRIYLAAPLALVLFLEVNFLLIALTGIAGAGSPWQMRILMPLLMLGGTFGHFYGRKR